jgi:hypothetical protein
LFDTTGLLSARGTTNHLLFPQSAGYGFAPTEGVRWLHFVGPMHELDGDWEALLTQLVSRGKGGGGLAASNASRPSSRLQHVNGRRQPSIGANERAELHQHPVVAKHLAWDFRCFRRGAQLRQRCRVSFEGAQVGIFGCRERTR